MASLGPDTSEDTENSSEEEESPLQKCIIKSCIKKNKKFHKQLKRHHKKTLAILKMHPCTPEPDFDIEALGEAGKRISKEWSSGIEDDDDEILKAYFQEHDDLNDDETNFLFPDSAAAAAPPSGKVRRFFSIFSKKKDKPQKQAEVPAEESKSWKFIRNFARIIEEEYRNSKTKIQKVISSEDEGGPTGHRTNTPVTRDAIADEAIENIMREIALAEYARTTYKDQLDYFKLRFSFLRAVFSDDHHLVMNPDCTKDLRFEIKKLYLYRASADNLASQLDYRLNHNEIFLECVRKYERLHGAKKKSKLKGMLGGLFKIKEKRKSTDKEDEEKLLDHTPKGTKEDEEDVFRRFGKTSSDEDDE